MYEPSTGRWMSEDPIAFSGGDPDLYRYVGNDATNATDPTGMDRYVIGGKCDGDPTEHSRLAVDLWEKKDGVWVNVGIATYELGGRDGSSTGWSFGIEGVWNFWCATGLGVTGVPVTKTDGLHLKNSFGNTKAYDTITSGHEADIELFESLEADAARLHLFNGAVNNCHLWVGRRKDIGIE